MDSTSTWPSTMAPNGLIVMPTGSQVMAGPVVTLGPPGGER
ncbi:hypothetical protein ACRYCC_24860 [Actinomadura scrupuli]